MGISIPKLKAGFVGGEKQGNLEILIDWMTGKTLIDMR